MLHDYLISLIRTYVPAGVAVALTWAAVHWGVVLPQDLSAELATVVAGLVLAGYYSVVRALEARWPAAGRLLGRRAAPSYGGPFWGIVPGMTHACRIRTREIPVSQGLPRGRRLSHAIGSVGATRRGECDADRE